MIPVGEEVLGAVGFDVSRDGGGAVGKFPEVINPPGGAVGKGDAVGGAVGKGDTPVGGTVGKGEGAVGRAVGGAVGKGDGAVGGAVGKGDGAVGGTVGNGDGAVGGAVGKGEGVLVIEGIVSKSGMAKVVLVTVVGTCVAVPGV